MRADPAATDQLIPPQQMEKLSVKQLEDRPADDVQLVKPVIVFGERWRRSLSTSLDKEEMLISLDKEESLTSAEFLICELSNQIWLSFHIVEEVSVGVFATKTAGILAIDT